MSAQPTISRVSTAPMADVVDTNGSPPHDTSESRRQDKPAKTKRNMFGPSEPSIAKPESSRVAAEGKVQKRTKSVVPEQTLFQETVPDPSPEEAPLIKADPDPQPIVSPFEDPLYEVKTLPEEPMLFKPDESVNDPVEVLQEALIAAKEQDMAAITEPDDNGTKPTALNQTTEIEILGPSHHTSEMHTPMEVPRAMASASSVVIPSVPNNSTPALQDLILDDPKPSDITDGIQPLILQTEPQAASEVIHDTPDVIPTLVTSAAIDDNVPAISTDVPPRVNTSVSVPNSTIEKPKKRRRMIRRMRKVLLRKRVLALLLGKELGGITHAQLQESQNVMGAVNLKSSTQSL